MDDIAVIGFLLAISVGFIASLLSKSAKLPYVPMLLIVAALMGPYGMEIVDEKSIDIFASIGAVLLLYVIGLEMRTEELGKLGLISFVFAILKIFLVAFFVALVALYFEIPLINAVLLGFTLAITSTAIFARAIKDFKLSDKKESKIIYTELVWEDVFAVIFIAAISSSTEISGGALFMPILNTIFFGILILLMNFFILGIVELIPKDDELYFLFYLSFSGLILLLGLLFSVPPSVAAFFAGVTSSTHKQVKGVREKIEFFTSLFVMMFFLSLGMKANFLALLDPGLLLTTFVFLILSIVAKMAVSSASLIFFKTKVETAALMGILMVSTGEFSMLIAVSISNMFSFDIVTITTAIVFLSSILTWFLAKHTAAYTKILSHFFKVK
ncbi:MAG: cation:proton antiporter [Candidatus Anstonellales archaeon]